MIFFFIGGDWKRSIYHGDLTLAQVFEKYDIKAHAKRCKCKNCTDGALDETIIYASPVDRKKQTKSDTELTKDLLMNALPSFENYIKEVMMKTKTENERNISDDKDDTESRVDVDNVETRPENEDNTNWQPQEQTWKWSSFDY